MLTEEKISKRFEEDKKQLVSEILKALPFNPIAILLYGGYGRGEGAWYEENNGEVMPYNDYDIDIICEQKIDNNFIQKFRKELALKVGVRWIDIGVIHPKMIKNYKPTIKNIDLKEASTLLYGDKSIYDLFPTMNVKDIGETDIILLYKTRIWTFLGSWEGSFKDLNIEESRFFKNQMAKATLAVCDLLLIAKQSYTPSYVKRAEIASSLFPNIANLEFYCKWAIKEKLRPSSDELKRDEMVKIYAEIKQLFCTAMKISYGKKWKYYENPDRTFKYSFYHSTRFLHSICHKLLRQPDTVRKVLDVFCAQNYVFHAWNNGNINKDYIEKASSLLLKWNYIKSPVDNWDELRLLVAFARNNT